MASEGIALWDAERVTRLIDGVGWGDGDLATPASARINRLGAPMRTDDGKSSRHHFASARENMSHPQVGRETEAD